MSILTPFLCCLLFFNSLHSVCVQQHFVANSTQSTHTTHQHKQTFRLHPSLSSSLFILGNLPFPTQKQHLYLCAGTGQLTNTPFGLHNRTTHTNRQKQCALSSFCLYSASPSHFFSFSFFFLPI